ncbi:ABC transporter permease [Halorarius litoreus]|uniref:ABC transporter permease n=1 Tax=Halorarius litoreus TaxID=2962676 RepID=UPI0020CE941B|nr:ABC transporter permease [Halorarius litoreus]
MTRTRRIRSEVVAAGKAFLRRRTAVFFTFFFPAIIILIFGALIQTAGGSGGLFTEPAGYYVPGYLAVVVLFTPLSRVGSEVARHREGNRFEKLATTPLRRWEWLLGQTLVNVGIIGAAAVGILVLVTLVTDAAITFAPVLVPYIALGVALFCGLGAILGRLSDSQDGVIAASNGIALPLLFLSETFVPPSLLPEWLPLWVSPLTYFSRGVRAATFAGSEGAAVGPLGPVAGNLVVLTVLAVAFFAVGAAALPRTD